MIGVVDPSASDTCWFTGISALFGSRSEISFLLVLSVKGSIMLVGVTVGALQ